MRNNRARRRNKARKARESANTAVARKAVQSERTGRVSGYVNGRGYHESKGVRIKVQRDYRGAAGACVDLTDSETARAAAMGTQRAPGPYARPCGGA